MRNPATCARVGLGLIAGAGIMSMLFGGRNAVALLTLGRLFVLLGLCYYAGIGRRWAAAVLSVLVVGAIIGLVVGALNAGTGSLWGMRFLANTLPYAAGLWLFLGAGGSRATRRSSTAERTDDHDST
jgi:hypothetical protein